MHLWKLPPQDRVSLLASKFEAAWAQQLGKAKPSLVRVVGFRVPGFRAFGLQERRCSSRICGTCSSAGSGLGILF